MRRGIRKTQPQATNKQANKQTKPNQSDVGTIHKFEQGTNAGAGGAGAEGRGDSTHLDKLNVLKKKWINISQQPKPRRWRASLAAPVFVSLQGQLCAALLHFSSPPLSLFPMPHLCQHLGVLFFASLSSRSVWKVNWIFHQRVDPSVQHQRPHSSGN